MVSNNKSVKGAQNEKKESNNTALPWIRLKVRDRGNHSVTVLARLSILIGKLTPALNLHKQQYGRPLRTREENHNKSGHIDSFSYVKGELALRCSLCHEGHVSD